MKISTAQFFRSNAEALTKGQFTVSELQAKLGSGKQLTSPSQDPHQAGLISRLESNLERQAIYQENIAVAKTRLTSEETALSSITEVFLRASELAIQGANGTMAVEDRAVLGAEVGELRKELVRLANTRDVNGEYIFAGNRVDKAPFVDDGTGQIQYVGDIGKLNVNVSDSRSVAVNTVGSELLLSEDFSAIRALEEGLIQDDIAAVRSSIDSIKASSDKISVSFGRMAGRVAALDSQSELLEDTSLRLQSLLSENRDLDYAKAITMLSRESMSLQALQASFTKIAQLSLFNFIR